MTDSHNAILWPPQALTGETFQGLCQYVTHFVEDNTELTMIDNSY